MRTTARRTALIAALALALTCTGAPPAALASQIDGETRSDERSTVRVSGRQIPVDVDAGLYEMRGSLIGEWRYIPQEVLHNDPDRPTLYVEAGVEIFTGCIDRRPRDGRCTERDHRGELHLAFLYWASYDLSGDLLKGQCVHPITGGKGAFAGARGLLNMVDRPTENDVRTTYRGRIELNAVPSEGDADTPTPSSAAASTVDRISSATSTPATMVRRAC